MEMVVAPLGARAEVRTSADYSISAEATDGGGRAVSSARYSLVGSVATVATGGSASSDYSVEPGFAPAADPPEPPPPTAAGLAHFRAVRWSDGRVDVTWQTLVEVQVLGYRVERSVAGGGWAQVGADLIPAEGQPHPQSYALTDVGAGVVGGAIYRLIEIDLRGRVSVVAEAEESAGLEVRIHGDQSGLVLQVGGSPGAPTLLQVAERIEGPWSRTTRGKLDGHGEGSFRVDWTETQPARFFRVVQE